MSPPAGRRPGLGYALSVTTAAQAGTSWSLFIFPPIAYEVAAAFGVDAVYVGYQVGILFTVTIIATLYSGAVVGRVGAVRSIQLAIVLALLGILACAAHTIAGMVAGAALFGLSHSLVNPATAMILRERVSPSRRGLVFSVKQASVPIGMVMSSMLGPALVQWGDWRYAMVPLYVVLIVLAIAVDPLRQPQDRDRGRAHTGQRLLTIPFHALAAVWGNRPLLMIACAGLSFGMCQGAVVTFTGNMFTVELGRSLQVAGLVLAFAQVGGIVGRLTWGHLADRIENPVLVLRCIAVMAIATTAAVAALPAATPLAVWHALFFAIGFSAVGWNGLLISEFSHLSRGVHVEQQMAGAFFLLFCGATVSSLLFPRVYDMVGSYAATISLFGLVCGLSALLLVRHPAGLPLRHHPDTPLERDF